MKVAREVMPFASIAVVAAIAAAFWIHPWASAPFVLFLLFSLWFFRDPKRHVPDLDDALICPADGKVIQAGPQTISIFMNVFNVHICRTPIAGVVETVQHHDGRFLAAFREDAPRCNERTEIVVAGPGRKVRFTLIAGLIARRIVCKVGSGDGLAAGQRVGLIRFGSRVDVAIDPDDRVEVRLGDVVKAGETVLARFSAADR